MVRPAAPEQPLRPTRKPRGTDLAAEALAVLRRARRPLSAGEIARRTGRKGGHGAIDCVLLKLAEAGLVDVLDRGEFAAKRRAALS